MNRREEGGPTLGNTIDQHREVTAPGGKHPEDYIMIWVDTSLFEVMDGPDWEKGPRG